MNTEKAPKNAMSDSRVGELRHLYRSVIRMARSDAVDTLLNYLVEDIIEITKFERVIVLFYNQQVRTLESRIFYGLDDIQDINIPFSQVNGLLKRAYADRKIKNQITKMGSRWLNAVFSKMTIPYIQDEVVDVILISVLKICQNLILHILPRKITSLSTTLNLPIISTIKPSNHC